MKLDDLMHLPILIGEDCKGREKKRSFVERAEIRWIVWGSSYQEVGYILGLVRLGFSVVEDGSIWECKTQKDYLLILCSGLKIEEGNNALPTGKIFSIPLEYLTKYNVLENLT